MNRRDELIDAVIDIMDRGDGPRPRWRDAERAIDLILEEAAKVAEVPRSHYRRDREGHSYTETFTDTTQRDIAAAIRALKGNSQ
jgi:hypothetical protein